MFEHIVGQNAITQLIFDRTGGTLAPSMLFSGPPASGKGTAGLELGRVLSCENPAAPADCACNACVRHRLLTNPDILNLGSRNFSAEISASAAALLREPETTEVKRLFIRSVRKLLIRFSPVLWEDEPKFGKLGDTILSLEEALDEIWTAEPSAPEALQKRCASILKNAIKLEADGMSELISIGQIRRAAAWSHLAPMGKRKLLLIENADRMQEAARNALLKILEEPPDPLIILLTTSREKALLPTILSRVRPYRFILRSHEVEIEVIRRVFRDESVTARVGLPGIGAYLDSFLPVSAETLRPWAAFFAAFIAAGTALALRKRGISSIPHEIVSLGKDTSAVAEAAGLGKPGGDAQSVVTKVLAGAEKFEIRGLFPRFLNLLLGFVSDSLRQSGVQNRGMNGYYDIWRKYIGEAAVAVGIYNQSPALTLERLGTELMRAMARR